MPRTMIRQERLSIRVDPARKSVITRAAAQQGTTVSEFVLDQAYSIARELLNDEEPLKLTKRDVAYLFKVLDNPPAKKVAAIRKLLSEPSVLDG